MRGRSGIFENLKCDFAHRKPAEKVFWMHCASLGEFEQGRTLVEALKAERPEIKVLLSFFSPSGYELRKKYELADWVYYLPADTASNARQFIGIVRPALVVFVKYEFWYHHLRVLKENGIPTLLVAARFRAEQPFFRWYGGLHRQMLTSFTRIFVQDKASAVLLAGRANVPAEVAGDTRMDRVAAIARKPRALPLVEAFCEEGAVLVCGSTWPEDESVLFETLHLPHLQHWKIILAPHEVQAARLQQIEKRWGTGVLRYSQAATLNRAALKAARFLLIDSLGLLAWLYRFGKVAYVGGGFGAGIHNTLEPAAQGLPVIFGPKYHKFGEAEFLLKNGGGLAIRNVADLEAALHQLADVVFYKKASEQALHLIQQGQGATAKIVDVMIELVFPQKGAN